MAYIFITVNHPLSRAFEIALQQETLSNVWESIQIPENSINHQYAYNWCCTVKCTDKTLSRNVIQLLKSNVVVYSLQSKPILLSDLISPEQLRVNSCDLWTPVVISQYIHQYKKGINTPQKLSKILNDILPLGKHPLIPTQLRLEIYNNIQRLQLIIDDNIELRPDLIESMLSKIEVTLRGVKNEI